MMTILTQFVKNMQMIKCHVISGFHGLNLNRGSHKLLVDRPYTSQICGLIPSVQNGNHFANPLEVAFEHLFQILTASTALFNQNSVLVVGKETHEEVTRAIQVLVKRLQSALDLHAMSWVIGVV